MQMAFHRTLADPELSCNSLIRKPLRDELDYFHFTFREFWTDSTVSGPIRCLVKHITSPLEFNLSRAHGYLPSPTD